MDIASLLPFAVAIAVTGGLWAMMSLINHKPSRADERLDEMRDPSRRKSAAGPDGTPAAGGGGVGDVFKKAAPGLAATMKPKTELEENALKVKLSNAGFNSPAAPQLFLAIKAACFIGGALVGGAFGVVSKGLTLETTYPIIFGVALGLYIPGFVLSMLKSAREQRIFLQLPDALDLMVVCTESGLGLDVAMQKVSHELKETAPDICAEFDIAQNQLNKLGMPRREVLQDLGVRTGVDDVKRLATVLVQADRFGTGMSVALRNQSDDMRIKRRQMAEEKAQQTAVKLIFPLVLFIFPGIFVILVGPAAIMMVNDLFTKM